MLSEADRKIVKRFKNLMLDRGIPVLETIAFGSRARGDGEPDSDLDVLVIVERSDLAIENAISECAWEVEFDPGVLIQSVVMTRHEVQDTPQRSSLFMMAVRRDGVKV